MKTPHTLLFTLIVLFTASTLATAQYEFGFKPYCEQATPFPAKKLSASTLKEIFKAANATTDPNQFCLGVDAKVDAEGFEADFDASGKPAMLLLMHTGPADAGCNTIFMIREDVNKSYTFLDAFNVAPGKTNFCPTRILPKGNQFYVQSTYTLPDGAVESKGALFAFEKELIVVLISWTQKDGTIDGKRIVTQAQCALSDVDYNGAKELFLKYSTYQPGAGKPDEKNMTDQYALSLQFAFNHYRYLVYDSSGYDKIQKAEQLQKSGDRLLYREETAEEGVVKLREAISTNPFLTDAYLSLGRYFLRVGKPSDAERSLLQATEIDPYEPQSYRVLGEVYVRLNTLDQALFNLRKYLELNPNAKDKKKVNWMINQITVPKRRR